jgi:hypothetical protein
VRDSDRVWTIKERTVQAVEDNLTMPKAFQFGVRDLLRATVWLAVGGAAFSMLRHDTPVMVPEQLWPILLFVVVFSPFMCVCALIRRYDFGLIAGLIVFALLWLMLPGVQ